MATGKPGININITADAAAAKTALAQTAAALDKTSSAANKTAGAVEQINNTSRGLLSARQKVAELQAELAKLKDAAVQAGKPIERSMVQQYKKALSAARVVVADEREKLAKAMAEKPVIIPVRPQVLTESKDPTLTAKELASSRAARQSRYLRAQLAPQFTDIVTSLQGGMNPLTVLLQQGGQIKDMYALAGKSVGQALADMGRYVVGLINPVTALAAAVGVATVGFIKGRAEAEAFRDTLALSNNTIGTTVDALSSMAQAIDAQSFGTTRGAAAELLNVLAATGAVGADALEGIAAAALRLELVGGPAASKTIEAFVALGKNPTEALGNLNKALGFVTRAQYEQVRALELAGRTSEAAALAQELYRKQLNDSTNKIQENLGTLESAAKATAGFFKEMWDAILDIGREETLDEKIAAVEKRLATLRAAKDPRQIENRKPYIEQAEEELRSLKEQKRLRDEAAAKSKATAAQNRRDQRDSFIQFKSRGEGIAAMDAALTAVGLADWEEVGQKLKAEYERGELDLEEYYRRRREIIVKSNEWEAFLAKSALDLAKQNLMKAPLEDRESAKAAVTDAQARVDVGKVQGRIRLLQLDADLGAARRDLARSTGEYAVKVAELNAAEADSATLKTEIALAEERYRNALAATKDPAVIANIKQLRDNEVATAQLKAQQVALERELAPFLERRAQIESNISAGLISAEAGELQMFELEKARNALLSARLGTMQQINNLSVQQRSGLDVQWAQAWRGAGAQGGAQNLRVQQAAQQRQLVALGQQRAAIEQQLRNGQISQVEAAHQLYTLDRQRNQLLLDTLTAMQKIPGLTVDQKNALKDSIEDAKLGLKELTPFAREFNTAMRSGLESAFTDALLQVRSLKEGLRSAATTLLRTIGQEIARIYARRAAASAVSGLTKLFGFAEGGHVRGPGTETSDSIPALLSDNEFVMPAKAVRAYGVGFMEAIRNMQLPTAPRVARYAEGGLVSAAATAGSSQQTFPVQVVVNNEGTPKSATAQTDFDGKALVVSVLLNDIKNNGPVFRSMSSAQKVRR